MGRLSEVINSAIRPITGVSLVPVYQYPLDGFSHSLRGRHCVFLGREKGGLYRNKLNFFGGKVDSEELAVEALIRETAEEMCVKLTPEVLDLCVVDAQLLPCHSKRQGHEYSTLLVFVHITGIKCLAWYDVMKERRRQHASGSLLEMSEVWHVPVDELLTIGDNLSSYVSENVDAINHAVSLLSAEHSVSFQDLPCVLFPEVLFKSRPVVTAASDDTVTVAKVPASASDSR